MQRRVPQDIDLLFSAGMLLLVPVLLLAALVAFQDKLILQPDFTLPSWRAQTHAADLRPWEEDGSHLGYVLEATGTTRGTVILYHGNAGSAAYRAPLAREFARRGLRVVLVEYPGYGERKGRATVPDLLTASLADFERARRTWPQPLYLAGESLGAGIASQVAGRHGHLIDGVLLLTPWDSLAAVARSKTLHLPLDVFLQEKLDTVAALAAYRGSLVILAAERDSVIPAEHARTLARAFPRAFYMEVPQANHNTWMPRLAAPDWDRLIAALTATSLRTESSSRKEPP